METMLYHIFTVKSLEPFQPLKHRTHVNEHDSSRYSSSEYDRASWHSGEGREALKECSEFDGEGEECIVNYNYYS